MLCSTTSGTIAAWRKEYNEVRPHSSLRYRTQNEFASQAGSFYAGPAHFTSRLASSILPGESARDRAQGLRGGKGEDISLSTSKRQSGGFEERSQSDYSVTSLGRKCSSRISTVRHLTPLQRPRVFSKRGGEAEVVQHSVQ